MSAKLKVAVQKRAQSNSISLPRGTPLVQSSKQFLLDFQLFRK